MRVCVGGGGGSKSPEAIHVHLAAHLPYSDLGNTTHIWFQLKTPNQDKCYGASLWERGGWVDCGCRRGMSGGGREEVGGSLRSGLCRVEGFFMCAERPQHSNLFHIPKTNQAGYFHSGRELTVEVGLKRVAGATELHMRYLMFLGTC